MHTRDVADRQTDGLERPTPRRLSEASVLQLQFLTCVSHTAHVISYRLDVCLSVCPSVTRWYCVEAAQPIVWMETGLKNGAALGAAIQVKSPVMKREMSVMAETELRRGRNGF